MRKYILVLVSFCVSVLAGCNNETVNIVFPFEAHNVENIEMYHFVSPDEAEKKVITKSEDIEDIYKIIEHISLKDKKTKSSAGGSVTSFRFNLSDDTSYEVVYSAVAVKSGRIITTDMEQDFFTDSDIESNWKNFDYEAVSVEEGELPRYNS